MKVYSVLLILFFFCIADNYGQVPLRDRHHLVFGIGGSGFMGDLGGADDVGSQYIRDFDFKAVRPSLILGHKYYITEDVALRSNVVYGQISGNDRYTDQIHRNNRNIHFRSSLAELSFQGEYYFFSAERIGASYRRITGTRGWMGYNIYAYAFGGIGGFYFNSKAKFNKDKYMELNHGTVDYEDLPDDGWYELRPLSTEGQGFFPTRDKYNQIQLSMPLGIGVLFQINRTFSVGLEYGFRKTWTNYIDDVGSTYIDPVIYRKMWPDDPQKIALGEYFSNPTNNSLGENVTAPGQQRGGSSSNDSYMFGFITLYYRLSGFGPGYGLPWF